MTRRAVLRVPIKTFDIDAPSSLSLSLQAHFRELEFLGVEQGMLRFLVFYHVDNVRDSFVYGFRSFNNETYLPLCADGEVPLELTVRQLNRCLLNPFFQYDSGEDIVCYPWKVHTVAVPIVEKGKDRKSFRRRISQE